MLSVHTVVSFDFTIAIVPGWHSTIFPPYFVAGAIYSGFAMVLVLCIPLRAVYGLKNLITERHLNNCAKLMLATGLILAYTYCIEPLNAWYSGNRIRDGTRSEPRLRSAVLELLGGDPVQRSHPASALVLQGPHQSQTAVCSLGRRSSTACGWNAT